MVVRGQRQPQFARGPRTVASARGKDPQLRIGVLSSRRPQVRPVRCAVVTADERLNVPDVLSVALGRIVAVADHIQLPLKPTGIERDFRWCRDQQAVDHGRPGGRTASRRRPGGGPVHPFDQPAHARATETEVDAPGMDVRDGPELFRDDDRRVVPGLYRTGPDPDRLGGVGDQGDQHGRRGGDDTRSQMVFGEPVPGIAETLCVAGKVDRVA